MVYSAIQNQISFQAWHLFISSTLWSVIYDTQYALVDREYDLKLGIKSSAIWFGENIFTIITLLQVLFISLWIYFGIISSYNIWYYSIICMIIITAYYQHNLAISDTPEKQFLAFKNNQWVGLIILLALYSQYL
jgi:4-hydroxybenzoate polyprenyltransferase